MFQQIKSITLIIMLSLLIGCSPEPEQKKIRLGINPWPGYEFLYLANQKGFFKDAGLNVELVELASLADIKRVFEQGRIDAMASTIIEAVEVSLNLQQKISIILVPDFSNGGDVIIARAPISTISELKSQRVGVELGLLGSFILEKALSKHGLNLDDVEMVNVEQLNAQEQMVAGDISAFISYPPFSTNALKHDDLFNQIFSTAEIPGDVIDVISVRENVLTDPYAFQQKLFSVWQRALDYTKSNSEDAYQIMAEREGISINDFIDALTGIAIIDTSEQPALLHSNQLTENINKVCMTLNQVNKHNYDCGNITQLIHPLTP